MQYSSIDYSHNHKMKWLTSELQELFNSFDVLKEDDRKLMFERICKERRDAV